ncbi:MAG: energy-coupling factor ABC transporter ATP-binding protein [Candidatus Caldatribacteriaceae bacterium]
MDNRLFELESVSFTYPGGIVALRNVSLAIIERKKTVFLGANGSGKSTLFWHLNGLLKPNRGYVRYRGEDVRYDRIFLRFLRQKVGVVFQDPDRQLFAGTVFQDVSFGPLNLGLHPPELNSRILKALQTMDILNLKDRPVHLLSYGEKKRVAIAGVLAMNPEVLVLDEPTASLDPQHEERLVMILEDLHLAGINIIVSTHDVDFAYSFADYLFVLSEGSLLASGEPERIFADEEIILRARLRKPILFEVGEILSQKGIIRQAFPRKRDKLRYFLEAC